MKGKVILMKELLAKLNRLIPRTRKQLKKFWLREDPKEYLLNTNTELRTNFLVKKINELEPLEPKSILEIGCNCGRNLKGLYDVGYRRLSGIDINPEAFRLMEKKYPELLKWCDDFYRVDINDIRFPPTVDLTFTMAVLEHLPSLNFLKWLNTKYFITMEDERGEKRYWYFKRNYKEEFEKYGYEQIEEAPLDKIISPDFTYRLFIKK